MQTALYRLTFKDGREFRVFCENKKQIDRVLKSVYSLSEQGCKLEIITNGIHTVKQWEQIVNKL